MLKTSSEYQINNQTILKEHIDKHYELNEEEILEYASYIGIDSDKVIFQRIKKLNKRIFQIGNWTSLVSKRRFNETINKRLEIMSGSKWWIILF